LRKCVLRPLPTLTGDTLHATSRVFAILIKISSLPTMRQPAAGLFLSNVCRRPLWITLNALTRDKISSEAQAKACVIGRDERQLRQCKSRTRGVQRRGGHEESEASELRRAGVCATHCWANQRGPVTNP
jgi:hypothetical protein